MTPTHHLQTTPKRRPLAARCALLTFAVITGACSLNNTDSASVSAIDVEPEVSSQAADESVTHGTTGDLQIAAAPSTTSPLVAPSTTEPPTTASTTTAVDAVAGEALDYGPLAGTNLIVVGVEYDDVLNFRVDPDPQAPIVATAAPLSTDNIVAAGSAWAAPSGVWWMVTIDGQTAWANQRYLAAPGDSFDATAEVLADLGSGGFETMTDAGTTIAEGRTFEGGPEPRFAQLNEVVLHETGGVLLIDVLDLGDDSVKGERIALTFEPIFAEDGDEGAREVIGVRVISVELTPLCGRGELGGLCL